MPFGLFSSDNQVTSQTTNTSIADSYNFSNAVSYALSDVGNIYFNSDQGPGATSSASPAGVANLGKYLVPVGTALLIGAAIWLMVRKK